MTQWLKDTQLFITENELTPDRIVCMDQTTVWDAGIPLKSYGLIGG